MKDYKEELLPAINDAKEHPYHVKEIIVEGFQFLIHFNESLSRFQAVMSFNPHWPHLHYIYGDTEQEIIVCINEEINDCMKIYTNGGKYKKYK